MVLLLVVEDRGGDVDELEHVFLFFSMVESFRFNLQEFLVLKFFSIFDLLDQGEDLALYILHF